MTKVHTLPLVAKPASIAIRKTRNYDLVTRLDKRCFAKDAEEADPAAYWWVAYVDGKLAGYAGLKACSEDGHLYGILLRAGVLFEFRGLGLQRKLIEARDKEARKLGLTCNITYVADWNLISANNLIQCGYLLYDPDNVWGLKKALYFKKRFNVIPRHNER